MKSIKAKSFKTALFSVIFGLFLSLNLLGKFFLPPSLKAFIQVLYLASFYPYLHNVEYLFLCILSIIIDVDLWYYLYGVSVQVGGDLFSVLVAMYFIYGVAPKVIHILLERMGLYDQIPQNFLD